MPQGVCGHAKFEQHYEWLMVTFLYQEILEHKGKPYPEMT